MTIKKADKAVSEIIGTVLLLAVAVSAFSLIYLNVLSDQGPSPEAIVTIVGKLEANNVVMEHRSGESLGLNTKVMLNLGGIEYIMTVEEFLIDSNEDKVWNIGERFVYPFNIMDLQVESTVVDIDSNSIVMWGILQEGNIITIPGGVWHFDENGGGMAHDSLNSNHGRLMPDGIFGPKWSNEIKIGGASALKFDGLDDYVQVAGNSVSLDITDEITVEAWVRLPVDHVLSNFTYGETFGYEPNIIHVSGDVYAVAYKEHPNKYGVLKTVKIAPDGTITKDIHNNKLTFGDHDSCYWPKIIHVSEDVYLIAYAQSKDNSDVRLKTVNIANNGTTGPVLGSFTFGSNDVYDPELIHISGNISAIVCRDGSDNGLLKTVEIADNGTTIITDLVNGTFEFDTSQCYEPDIAHISGDSYVIAYSGDDSRGFLKTVEIKDDGTIVQHVNDTLIFDSVNETYESEITHISGNTYAIAYRDDDYDGLLKTVEIANDGTITDQVIDTLKFEDDYCRLPNITRLFDDVYLIVYETDQQDGFVAVVEIASSGSISDNVISKFQFNTGKNYHGLEPNIIRISDEVYAIVFRSGSSAGSPHQGHLLTGRLNNTDYPPDPSSKAGIVYKEDIYGIYLNRTHLYVTLNNNPFPCEMTLSPDWNHIAFTYDGSTIRLYCNGNETLSDTYNGGITHSPNGIYFGKLFYGYIDEVAIFNRALSATEIQDHYNNPGSLP